jgi:hypothetical protein
MVPSGTTPYRTFEQQYQVHTRTKTVRFRTITKIVFPEMPAE